MDPVLADALFLGPQSENREYFAETLEFLIDEHVHWRRNFHPEDDPIADVGRRRSEAYDRTLERTTETLLELSGRLKATSMPWFSPRYLGHMNADTLMAATLAYMATILYNPNNVAYEASPATTPMEIEVGEQLAALFGLDPERAWGHITADGTIANYEGLWIARNLRSVPHAVAATAPELLDDDADTTAWALSNWPTDRILTLLDRVRDAGALEDVLAATVRTTGVSATRPGKLLVPQSKHYSLAKAADILGIGHDDLLEVPVDEAFRMDADALSETIDRLVDEREPILAVIPVVGTTEEGAVDGVHDVLALRDEWEDRGVSFHVHADAAYGGYARALFLDADGEFVAYDDLREHLGENVFTGDDPVEWPDEHVYRAYEALSDVDSIAVDPHKMGYVPYAAGGFVVRDRRMLDVVSYTAPYVFEDDQAAPEQLGGYILEGSKPGATVAATWAAHRVAPLDTTGYGQLVGRCVEGARHFYRSLAAIDDVTAGDRTFAVEPLGEPDLNIVVFAFNPTDNDDLERMDRTNRALYEAFSYRSGPVYANDFVTSKTVLREETYGDAPASFVTDLGVPAAEWDDRGEVFVLRSCVLTPYLAHDETYAAYWTTFLDAMQEQLAELDV